MAKLVTPPTRFTHQEWTTSNLTKYANAESERAAAERLVEESKRLSDETEKRTEKTQRDVNKKFRKLRLKVIEPMKILSQILALDVTCIK